MKYALIAALLMVAQPVHALEQPTQPIARDLICDGKGFGCKFVFGWLTLFAVIDWAVPLNDPNADPYRCRGEGSLINIPPPQGTSLCKPLPN